MDRNNKDRKNREDEMYQAHRRSEMFDQLLTAAVIIAVAIALGASVWAIVETFMFPLIDAVGGGR